MKSRVLGEITGEVTFSLKIQKTLHEEVTFQEKTEKYWDFCQVELREGFFANKYALRKYFWIKAVGIGHQKDVVFYSQDLTSRN